MNAPPTREAAVTPVDLGRTEDFALGSARVRPSAREIDIGGKVERLQPRVMQVLVALARAQGAVVSRDDLIEACWEGLAVGEDAINRVIGKLRRLAELAPGGFAIETVPKVGYRLIVDPSRIADAPTRHDSTTKVHVARQPALSLPRMRWRRAHVIVAAGAVALGAAVAGAMWRNAQPAIYSIERAELIVHSALKEEQPALSPNGQYILYAATPVNEPSATADLYMQAVSGGEPLRLTNTPLDDEQAPAWSPDGRTIAYVRAVPEWRDPNQPCRIFVRVAPDGEERLAGRCATVYWTGRLAWDPSGQKLLFADGPPPDVKAFHFGWRVRELDLRTGATRDLFTEPPPATGAVNAVFSPDGTRIGFVRYGRDFGADLSVYDIKQRRLRRISLGGAQAYISWSPDSRSMFAASNRFGPWDLWQVRADGRGVPLRMGVGPGTILRLSSAGDLLAFEQVSRRTNLVRVSAASGEAAVTSGNQEDLQPAYSPKGTLAFIRDLGVHIQWPDAAARRLVRLDLQAPRGLRWAPDESMLAFVATNRGVARLYLIDAESGRLRELATPGLEPGKPDWSRDGQSLVFFAGDARGLRLWRLPIRAGAAPREIRGYNLGHGFPWSDVRERPEGLFVASDFERAGVFRLDGVRGPQLLTPETRVRGVVTSWTVFRGRVYYTYAEDSQTLSLYRRSAAGGPATRIADLKTSFGDDGVLDVDPRTGDVVYSKMISEEYDIGLAHLRQSGRSWPQ